MNAIEYANRKGYGYQKCAGIFRRLQHEANEGTHAGHFNVLENLFKLYKKTSWQVAICVLYYIILNDRRKQTLWKNTKPIKLATRSRLR